MKIKAQNWGFCFTTPLWIYSQFTNPAFVTVGDKSSESRGQFYNAHLNLFSVYKSYFCHCQWLKAQNWRYCFAKPLWIYSQFTNPAFVTVGDKSSESRGLFHNAPLSLFSVYKSYLCHCQWEKLRIEGVYFTIPLWIYSQFTVLLASVTVGGTGCGKHCPAASLWVLLHGWHQHAASVPVVEEAACETQASRALTLSLGAASPVTRCFFWPKLVSWEG